MAGTPIDRELLDALVPEFEAALGRLQGEAQPARRALASLRDMAGALGMGSFATPFDAAAEALDAGDADAVVAVQDAMARHIAAIAAAGTDLPFDGPAPAAGGARIGTLIVDDSPTMRRIVRQILSADPAFDILGEAQDGAQALERMAALSPALVMLDIEMPVLDGTGVLRRGALTGGAGAIVVVSSAAPPGSMLARELRRLGAAAVVGKPSGALSFDLAERGGAAVLTAARRAAGLTVEAAS